MLQKWVWGIIFKTNVKVVVGVVHTGSWWTVAVRWIPEGVVRGNISEGGGGDRCVWWYYLGVKALLVVTLVAEVMLLLVKVMKIIVTSM